MASPDPPTIRAVEFESITDFRRILVCLDRSEAAEAVLPLAAHLAQADRASVTLMHVLEAPPEDARGRVTDALEWQIAREEARSYLDDVAARMADLRVAADSRVAEGSAAHAIAASAAELGADLVVLSTFGQSGLEQWPLGGTAQKVLALLRAAVLVVPAASGHPPQVPPHRIMVPLDGSLRGESVLPTALRLARKAGAEVVVAHVVPDPIRTEVLSTPEDLALAQQLADRIAARAQTYLEAIRSQLVAAGVPAHTAVCRAADHREGLVALAASERIDLVVIAAHGAICNPRRPFGSVTTYLLGHASAPVLVIQDLPGRTAAATAVRPSRLPPRSLDGAAGGF